MEPRSVKSRMVSLGSVLVMALLVVAALQMTRTAGVALADDDLTCEISIDKTNNTGGAVDEGDTFDWIIDVDIDEDCDGIDFTVEDNIPSGFDVIDFDDDGLDCDSNSDDGDIDCDANNVDGVNSWTIVVGLQANGEACGDRTNTAHLDSPDAVDDSDSNTVNVDCNQATIKVIKDTDPETSSPSFDFEIHRVGGGFSDDFSLADDQSVTFGVSAGTYIVEEDSENDWDLVDIDCTGSGNVSDDDANDGDVQIVVDENDSVTCTFTNQPEAKATPIILNPQLLFQIPTATPRPPTPAPVATVVSAAAAQLPRAGEGPQQRDADNGLLPVGGGLLALSLLGLAYWRISRAH